jgi:predicted nucleic acid-binding protein
VIILDTNVVSEPLKRAPDAGVLAWLDRQAVGTLHLTAVTVAELRYGVAALPPGRRRDVIARRIDDDVLPLFAGRILDFDLAAADAYGELRARARDAGRAIGDLDAMIGAIALAQGFVVATRDTAPFVAVGVEVINPFSCDSG